MTLGLSTAAKQEEAEEPPSDTLLANHSLLLILVLVNHCTKEELLYNPYREAIFSFTDSSGNGLLRQYFYQSDRCLVKKRIILLRNHQTVH